MTPVSSILSGVDTGVKLKYRPEKRWIKDCNVIQASKKANINDVARLAGVSKKTVSRVINDSPQVTEKTRAKVELVIKQLNYAPDPQARGLASQKSFLWGLVYDNPNASYISDIQQGVLDFCRTRGYELVVHPCDYDSPDLLSGLNRFITRLKVDGVIVLPPVSENGELADMLARSNCQHVRILSVEQDKPGNMVRSDDRLGATLIANHLAGLGHTEIGLILGPEHSKSAQERHDGFIAALAKRNITLKENHVVRGAYTYESGLACASKLLRSKTPPTAIFASNDEMALGALVAASKLGIVVPGQLSVVGYDDEPHASKLSPSLTTVNQDLTNIGLLAAEKMFALCKNDVKTANEVASIVNPKLIVRDSTAAAPV